jgi:hypothetical protein
MAYTPGQSHSSNPNSFDLQGQLRILTTNKISMRRQLSILLEVTIWFIAD